MPALHVEIAHLRAKAELYLAVASVLRVLALASHHAPLNRLLRIIGLSPSRYHAWKRKQVRCKPDDRSSCLRGRPAQLTASEVQAIKAQVVDPELRHMSLRSLSLHAQRISKVFASDTTWRRLIRRLRAIVEFYIEQHNGVMPHAAFDGQTPNEMFFGTGAGVGKAPVLCGLYEDGVLQ